MRFTIATAFSAFVALAAAYTAPDYNQQPSGNAIIYPSLNEIVPEGKAYTIKWTPTTVGPISLILLRGPSTNVLPLETLAESIPNSGEFSWTPSADLEADVTHYGLLLVVEGTGQYQYSTQFGISAAVVSSSSASVASTTSSVASSTLETTETTASASTPVAASTVIESTEITTTICPETETTAAATTAATTVATTFATTPAPKVTPTGVSPVKPPTSTPLTSIRLTTSAVPTASPSATPVFNSAGRNAISFGAVMAGVIAAFAL
ncbi:uncharacterized protein N7518_003929 [Penicillium psychrosexuale]|uniref:uncharacterized protein n=1 Tax=Penicillium psychrosexuale TaxID=1002107 RepID=UPI002545B082|nr:uncharacterized protein N7518_003929 [Penicillium psychrosexuale]KAJ5795389.1 hypothetical protein N7518_003929 [Penicillium psychrosexuale]